MPNQVVLRLSDEDLSNLQSALGTKAATVPSRQMADKALFIKSSKALNYAPGYNEVEIVLGHMTTSQILIALDIMRRKDEDVDWETVARELYKSWLAAHQMNASSAHAVGMTLVDGLTLEEAVGYYKKIRPVR